MQHKVTVREEIYMVGLDDDEFTRRDCEELIKLMEQYEAKTKEKLDDNVKIYTAKEYSQEFLKSLIPKKG